MKIYFVRHGETDMNARNMFYGWYDADINEKGIAQAEELRAAFEAIHIDAIYSSDLKRAYHTAEIIANGREIQPVPEIRELYYGDWENRTWEEMSEADLEEWHGWLTDNGALSAMHCHLTGAGPKAFWRFNSKQGHYSAVWVSGEKRTYDCMNYPAVWKENRK